MLTKEITSLQHPIVKHLVKLRKNREYRKMHQSALLTGLKLVKEVGELFPLSLILVEENYTPSFAAHSSQRFSVSHAILKKITGVETPEPIAAIAPLPAMGNLENKKLILVLDGIADPGNLGTLIRTALALGWDGAFITSNSADPFNEKALRAAKGATFRLPIVEGSHAALESFLMKNHMHAFVADVDGEPIGDQKLQGPMALILGNESRGASECVKQKYPRLSIPMSSHMESMNVAIAGGIFMHKIREMQRG